MRPEKRRGGCRDLFLLLLIFVPLLLRLLHEAKGLTEEELHGPIECGHSSAAAPGLRDCRAASVEVESSGARCPSRAPPPHLVRARNSIKFGCHVLTFLSKRYSVVVPTETGTKVRHLQRSTLGFTVSREAMETRRKRREQEQQRKQERR